MDHPQFDDEFLRAMGRMTVNYSILEIYVAFLLAGFIGADQQTAFLVIADQQMRWRLDKLEHFQRRLWDAETAALLGRWIRDARSAVKARNAIVHGTWSILDSGERAQLRYSARRKGPLVSFDTNPDDVAQVVDDLRDLMIERTRPLVVRLSAPEVPWWGRLEMLDPR